MVQITIAQITTVAYGVCDPVYAYETAWAAGPGISPGKDWAMYFKYAVQ